MPDIEPPPSRPCFFCDRVTRLPNVYVSRTHALCGYHDNPKRHRQVRKILAAKREVRRILQRNKTRKGSE